MTTPTKVVSRTAPVRWEDAMISGNGSTGIMVIGRPLDDEIIVNHAKCWVVGSDFRPKCPDLREAWKKGRELARQGRYRDADEYVVQEVRRIVNESYGDKAMKGIRPWYDRTHPAFHIHVSTEAGGQPQRYRRETNFQTGEVTVSWTDIRGDWRRRIFVSRTHNLIAMELLAPAGEIINASLRLAEAPGKMANDIRAVVIDHTDAEMYFHATYGRTMGKEKPEGYHALARVTFAGGEVRGRAGERLDVKGARRVLMLLRFEYLDDAAAGNRSTLRKALAGLPDDYEKLLAPHAAVHGGMFDRVTLDLGGDPESALSSEALLAQAAQGKMLPEFFALMHAAGRYALICGATGDLAPSLMGIWGNEWTPPWDGRYTFDANLNLAISAAAQGNLPEAMNTYAAFLELNMNDWRENARKMYGCRGVLTDLCQGWRHGTVLMATYCWTGGAGWLASYLYDYYLYTQDRAFLARHVVPLLKDVADFYEDFTAGYPEHDGKVVFYPSISPENVPTMKNNDQASSVVPNATGEIAICREALTNLVAACRELNIEQDNIPRWEKLLAKLPDYVINSDGALAEWSYPGMGDTYNHRHSSHLYGTWPSLEIAPRRTPKLFDAARVAMEKRLAAGLGGKSAHGLMHVSFVAARLKNPDLMWRMLSDFASLPFVNTSFITCHNPGPQIYNLDTTFSMPSVLMEMLLYSEPGLLEILPALPQEKFSRGTIRGALARGGVTVQELHWNTIQRQIRLTLQSARAQTVLLRSGVDVRFAYPDDADGRKGISHDDAKGGWQVELPAGEPVRLRLGM